MHFRFAPRGVGSANDDAGRRAVCFEEDVALPGRMLSARNRARNVDAVLADLLLEHSGVSVVAKAADKERASTALPSIQQIGFALGAALSGLIANYIGLGDGLTQENLLSASFWLFTAFLPLIAIGNIAAWRFTRQLDLP